MSSLIPSYVFHVPHSGAMINYEQLENKMKIRRPPEKVGVVDSVSGKRLGFMPPSIALMKFR